MRPTIIALSVLTLAVVGHGLLTPVPVAEGAPVAKPVVKPLPPCEVEDGSSGPVPCRWDASESGNGVGDSFVITSPDHHAYDDGHQEVVHADGTVTYTIPLHGNPLAETLPDIRANEGGAVFGKSWVLVGDIDGLGDALAEGETEAPTSADTRNWEWCLYHEGDTSYVVCTDGYIETS